MESLESVIKKLSPLCTLRFNYQSINLDPKEFLAGGRAFSYLTLFYFKCPLATILYSITEFSNVRKLVKIIKVQFQG
jgi:hypothetical protein